MDTLGSVKALIPDKILSFLPEEINSSVAFLLREGRRTGDRYQIEAVLDYTWEQLNTGKWCEVPDWQRHVFTVATLVKVEHLLRGKHHEVQELITELVEVVDRGLLLGVALPPPAPSLTEIASILNAALFLGAPPCHVTPNKVSVLEIEGVRGEPIPVLQCPSLEKFYLNHFVPQTPVKLTDCMEHWPALSRWTDLTYLKSKAGARTVPVELGRDYTHPDWTQRLMTLSTFLDEYVQGSAQHMSQVGYLAQHPLFDQIPELQSDIRVPEYCCLSLDEKTMDPVPEPEMNAWLGPVGTVSPLHFDPKHNLLAQVVGDKRVLLYPPESSELLYPQTGTMLSNTAQVDPETPDYVAYPNFTQARALETVLAKGEMLYIPPRWWHHVRSLSLTVEVLTSVDVTSKMDRLIQLVKHHPCLYDVHHPNYMSKASKKDSWDQIGRDWKVQGLSPKEEWRKLRDCHRDALRRQRLSSGSVPKQWKYMEKMSFLLPHMGVRPRYDMPSIKPLAPATNDTAAVDCAPPPPNPTPALTAAPTPPAADQQMDEEDDMDAFFEFVCQAAKKLPGKYRKQLREAVSDALRNAENNWEIEECLPPPEAVTLPPPSSPQNFKEEPSWDE